MRTKLLSIILLLTLLIQGCMSALVQNQSHGNASAKDVTKAAAIDIATLPIQVLALPVLAISSSNKKKGSEERQRKAEEKSALYKILVNNPEFIIENKYHNISDTSSVEFSALTSLLEYGSDTKFSYDFYEYVYENFTQKYHNRLRNLLLVNRFMPENILLKAYDEFVVNYTNDSPPDGPRSSYISSILGNPLLPENRIRDLQKHDSEYLRKISNGYLKKRQPTN